MDVSVCPRDGAALLDVVARPIEPTASIPPPDSEEILIDSGVSSHDSDVTRAARPGAVPRGMRSQPARSSSAVSAPPAAPPGRPPAQEGDRAAAGKGRARGRVPRQTDRPEDRIGRTLGSYRLLEIIGRGGMGCVYRAEHVKLGREVALKLLRSDYAERRDSVARFFQEARAVNRIRHRNIVDITDFVELDDGTTFIIMELLEGTSLSKLMRTPGALDTPRILALLLQICDGLAAAHSVGIIHRDMKPDNVFVAPTGDGADLIKLLDFGVAKLLTPDSEDIGLQTVAGSVIGTPAFMSPEQAGGMPVDARSDLYCVGAIMYELFCGQPPFRGKSFGEFVRKHLNERPVPPRQTKGGAGTDERVEAVIMRCLEKRPEDRYQSAAELRSELLDLLGVIETQTGRGVVEEMSADDFRALYGPPSGVSGAASSGSMPAALPASATGQIAGHGAMRASQPGVAHQYVPTPAPGTTGVLRQTGPQAVGYQSGASLGPPAPGVDTAMALGDLPRDPSQVRGPGRAVVVIGAAALLGGIAGLAIFLASRGGDHGRRAPVAARSLPATGSGAGKASAGPVVRPISPTATGGHPVSVRITSVPNAAVFAFGSQQPWCRTPCSFSINPDDDAPSTRRYIVREAGYQDHVLTIDLTTAPRARSFHVSLRRSGAAARAPGATSANGTAGAATAPAGGTAPGSTPSSAGGAKRATGGGASAHGSRRATHHRRRRRTVRHHTRRHHAKSSHHARKKHGISPGDTLNPFGS